MSDLIIISSSMFTGTAGFMLALLSRIDNAKKWWSLLFVAAIFSVIGGWMLPQYQKNESDEEAARLNSQLGDIKKDGAYQRTNIVALLEILQSNSDLPINTRLNIANIRTRYQVNSIDDTNLNEIIENWNRVLLKNELTKRDQRAKSAKEIAARYVPYHYIWKSSIDRIQQALNTKHKHKIETDYNGIPDASILYLGCGDSKEEYILDKIHIAKMYEGTNSSNPLVTCELHIRRDGDFVLLMVRSDAYGSNHELNLYITSRDDVSYDIIKDGVGMDSASSNISNVTTFASNAVNMFLGMMLSAPLESK